MPLEQTESVDDNKQCATKTDSDILQNVSALITSNSYSVTLLVFDSIISPTGC